MNPFMYIKYVEDNDQSGGSSSSSPCNTSSSVASIENSTPSSSSSQVFSSQCKVTISKQEALAHLKQIMHVNEPLNATLFERIFLSSVEQKSILEKRFGPITNSTKQIEGWINSCNAWGEREAVKLHGKKMEGRWLWVLLDKHLGVNATEVVIY